MCFDGLALKVLKEQFRENTKRSVSPGGKTAADPSLERNEHSTKLSSTRENLLSSKVKGIPGIEYTA
ncbi:hypothetical protein [Photobacterium sp.]|uniref:hypothetical protein n=1 Tax=Photobacterium sp. TaxID=660 RepID=UPI00299EF761|nr:hypothetical protein [Photobacterium sp.]MDX1300916.1 hypothetical protein [Photobacterium sp.]